jgi:hypothetical protein
VFGCSFHVFSVFCTELRLDKLHTTADATGVPAKSVEPVAGNKQFAAANTAATACTSRWAMVKHASTAASSYAEWIFKPTSDAAKLLQRWLRAGFLPVKLNLVQARLCSQPEK